MLKLLAIWPLILAAFTAQAQIDINSFIEAKASRPEAGDLDIGYYYTAPQYEENPDPKKQVTIEFFFGEYDGSPDSQKKLAFIKEMINDDKATSQQFSMESMAMAPHGLDIQSSEDIEDMAELLDLKEIRYENFQEGAFEENVETSTRGPSSIGPKVGAFLKNPRNYWTFIRTATGTAGVTASLIISKGVAPAVAASIGFVPGIASGGLTYFSGQFGNWITSGAWSKWLLESDSLVAKNMRKGMKFTHKSLDAFFSKTKGAMKKTNPKLYEKLAQRFAKKSSKPATSAAVKAARILSTAEEFVRSWVAEVAFTSLTIKLPQAVAGISSGASILSQTGDILVGATMGMAAQSPGDIAIIKRKYQKVEELKKLVESGKVPNSTSEIMINKQKVQKTLLEEIDMVLATTGEHKAYSINRFSHKALQKVENWAKSRATLLSFFTVTSVGMEIAHIPLAKPFLAAIGVGGGLYYAHVEGKINLKVPDKVKKIYEPFKIGKVSLNMRSVFSRMCQSKFAIRNP